ncbi:MAG: flagellar motor protein MotB [Geobacter sp.]|nr:MAG: flagellar motor protein MotB [Geobacter sp.]
MSTRRKILIGSAVLLVLMLLFAAFILPSILRGTAIDKIEAATGRKASIAKISINPLTLSGRVTDFRLTEKGNPATFASFSSVRVSVNPSSLVRRALIISRIEIDSPYVNMVRSDANTYNFTDLVTPKKDAKPSKPFPFSLNNIVIRGGAIDFHDLAARKPTNHTVRRMEIAVPFFSTIPYLADKYVAPRFSAVINGAELSATGKLKPLAKTMETSLNLKLKDFDLPYYLAYLPVTVPIGINSGKLSTDLELSYQVSARDKPEVGIAGRLELTGLDVREKSGVPLVALNRLAVQINKAAIFRQNFDLASLELDGVAAHLDRDSSGQWNFERLKVKQTAPPSSKTVQTGNDTPKPAIKLSSLKFTNGSIRFVDRVPPGGFHGKLEKVTLSLNDFSTAGGGNAKWSFACTSGRNESIDATGTATVEPLAVTTDLTARGIALGAYYPYLAGVLTAPITGTVDLNGHLAFDRNAGLTLERLALTGNNIASTFAPGEGIRMNRLAIGGVGVNLKGQNATVEQVEIKGASVQITREKDGTFSPMRLLRTSAGTRTATATVGTPKKKAPKPFSYKLRKVGGSGIGITFTDRAQNETAVISLRRLQFALANITGPRFGSIPFTLISQLGKQGTIRTNGTVIPSPLKLKGNVELKKIALRDFEAYLPENLNLYVADGTIDTRMAIALSKEPGKELSGSYNGNLGVRSFYCLDTVESEDLLKWESLQLDNIKGTLAPFSLSINEVALNNVYSRIVINKDGTLNLQNLTKKETVPAPQQAAAATIQPSSPSSAQTPPSSVPAAPQVRIGAVTIQEGTLAFSDRHLPGGFATTFYHLGGRVSGLSSEENRFADVDLRGNLENQSPLQITGTLNPLRNDLYADLKVSFTDIDLTPVTPYSGTYLGYTVEKGKLSLDLKYLIDKKALSSENKVFIDQFTFGKKVESERATNLPVRLAVALLKDRKGEIHLDLPVTGRTDDPKFSVWSVVLQMLKNLLVKAATSPLALLSSFGGSDDFSSVGFTPGSASLSPAEQEKLLKLAGSLNDRPSINLEISGFVDREKDREGYRSELLNRKLKAEKFQMLVKSKLNKPEQTPDNVEVLPDEYSRLLKEVYRKEKFPKPRNIIGLVKDLPDEEMKKLIITNTKVGDEQLGTLASDRATAVKNYLVEKGKMPAERLFLKRDDIYKAPAKKEERRSRVELGANVK